MPYRCLLLLLVALGLNASAQSSFTNDLILYYPFDGDASDRSALQNHGTNENTTPTVDRFGRIGGALDFNGSNSSVSCSVPQLPIGAAPRTVSLWAKARPDTSRGVFLIEWGTPQELKPYGIMNNNSPYTWAIATYGGNHGLNSGLVVDTNWHHIVAVYTGTQHRMFIDGMLRATRNETIDTVYTLLRIGRSYGDSNASLCYPGALDDIRIYRRALSSTEVAQLYRFEISPVARVRKAIFVETDRLYLGSNYQLQVTSDLINWTNSGLPFTATNTTWRSATYWDVDDWNRLFFRFELLP